MLDSFNQTNPTELIPATQVSVRETSTSPSMRSPVTSPIWSKETSWTQSLVREAQLIWQLIWRDISATIIPGVLLIVAAWNSQSGSLSELLVLLPCAVLYFALYIITFCFSNQITGIEEDRLNKPDRPLTSGAISYEGAQLRYVVSLVLFSLVGWWFGVIEWALLWQVCFILHNEGGWSKHWLGKNFIMGIGTIAELAAAWQLATPIGPDGWRWILMMGAAVASLAHLQDLRDVEGDRANDRKTFPIVFGQTTTRVVLCIGFVLVTLAIHFLLMMPAGNTWNVILSDGAVAALSTTIVARIIFCRSTRADHHTYMLLTYWYCLVLGTAIVVL